MPYARSSLDSSSVWVWLCTMVQRNRLSYSLGILSVSAPQSSASQSSATFWQVCYAKHVRQLHIDNGHLRTALLLGKFSLPGNKGQETAGQGAACAGRQRPHC